MNCFFSTTVQQLEFADARYRVLLPQSVQNSLEQVRSSLAQLPLYGSREVLFLVSALSTCDPGTFLLSILKSSMDSEITRTLCHSPGNVHSAISSAKQSRLRISVVALAAEMVRVARVSNFNLRFCCDFKFNLRFFNLNIDQKLTVSKIKQRKKLSKSNGFGIGV